MSVYQIIAVAVGLGLDAMSVCMAVGVKWHGPRQKFRLAWHMGLFQFLMPVIGWAGGRQLAGLLEAYGRYIAAGLVFAVGVKMLYEALKGHTGAEAGGGEQKPEATAGASPGADPTRGWSLMVLSLATSMDALVVGFSLGIEGQVIWVPSVVIGLTAGGMALSGVALGRRIGQALGRWAEIAGACVLIALAASFLWL
ncbi:MAG: putative manganese efflux pump MntP [Planctomycetes bacterium ADurb.Bin126]|nr:MAG: putative manganese efflux pump MntP [Planctomycetes bacterium ADurb.Bin126]HOD81670.1 manganese efflux pump MntP family protein [Phycisphaerae bacterium]